MAKLNLNNGNSNNNSNNTGNNIGNNNNNNGIKINLGHNNTDNNNNNENSRPKIKLGNNINSNNNDDNNNGNNDNDFGERNQPKAMPKSNNDDHYDDLNDELEYSDNSNNIDYSYNSNNDQENVPKMNLKDSNKIREEKERENKNSRKVNKDEIESIKNSTETSAFSNEKDDRNKIRDKEYSQEDIDEKMRYINACDEIEKELSKNMFENSIDISIDEKTTENARKRYKNIKTKKTILYGAIITTLAFVTIFGFYKTFFKHEYTGEEIAALANYYNTNTNFQDSGVQGYLNYNINKIMESYITAESGTVNIEIKNPTVTRINAKNDELANVYFYVDIVTNDGTQRLNCVLPLFWNSDKMEYEPGGSVIITPNKSTNNETDTKDNYLLSFENIEEESSENTESARVFVNNFFTFFYTGQDISQYYDGIAELKLNDSSTYTPSVKDNDVDSNIVGQSNIEYNGMVGFKLYKDTNQNGYNAYCQITLKSPNGTIYTTDKYITIKGKDKNWLITAVL